MPRRPGIPGAGVARPSPVARRSSRPASRPRVLRRTRPAAASRARRRISRAICYSAAPVGVVAGPTRRLGRPSWSLGGPARRLRRWPGRFGRPRGCLGRSARRLSRAPRRLLCRASLTEILDPVVVGVTSGGVGRPELILAAARLAAEAATSLRITHGPDRKRPAWVLSPETGLPDRAGVGVGGETPADWASRPGVVVLGVWPPQILLVLRPSRCHTDCYS
jgi:hypothetical protein